MSVDLKDSEIAQIAERLCPQQVTGISEIDRGGNSRIYKIETAGLSYALKRYPEISEQDKRDRLDTERKALGFLEEHGFSDIPHIVASDANNSYSLLTWCNGEQTYNAEDVGIDKFADFLINLAKVSHSEGSFDLQPASEACTCGQEIVRQIEKRLSALKDVAEENESLKIFLKERLLPDFKEKIKTAKEILGSEEVSFEQELDKKFQVLIPCDFGTHSCLRDGDKIFFLDFEYFGWDDPVTSTANFLLHPAMHLSQSQKERFSSLMANYFITKDTNYQTRLMALYPLYAIRWSTIILNEFLPQRWQHRLESGRFSQEDWQQAKDTQLEKARSILLMQN